VLIKLVDGSTHETRLLSRTSKENNHDNSSHHTFTSTILYESLCCFFLALPLGHLQVCRASTKPVRPTQCRTVSPSLPAVLPPAHGLSASYVDPFGEPCSLDLQTCPERINVHYKNSSLALHKSRFFPGFRHEPAPWITPNRQWRERMSIRAKGAAR
jgi:hypothetical protein